MNAIKVHLGYEMCEKLPNGEIFKSFDFDLTKFPLLFVNLGKGRVFPSKKGKTVIITDIIEQIIKLEEMTKNVKTLIIDNGKLIRCSALLYDTYCIKPQTALKSMLSLVNKIYNQYLTYPDFIPRTKYIIIVNNAWGLEQYLADIMEKLGPIGVYLVFSGGDEMLEYPVNLKKYLYGQIVCVFANDDYKGVYIDYLGCTPKYGMVMERLKPEHKLSKAIYPDRLYEEFYNPTPDPIDILFG